MTASDAALASGETRVAIFRAKDAAEARLPFSPWPAKGRARLDEIAREAENKGDIDSATIALRAKWAACSSTTIGAADPCATEAEQSLERVAARTGISEAPKEEPVTTTVWLPLGVVLGAIAAVALAARNKAAA